MRLKCDGTRYLTGGELKRKLTNGVGSQYSSHYLGTWCIQHYYRWCPHLGCQQSTELTPPPISMDLSVSAKDEIWFLRMCHHVSNTVYHLFTWSVCTLFQLVGQNIVLGIATFYWLDGPGIQSRWGQEIPHPSTPTLGPSQPPVKWALALFSGGKTVGAWRWLAICI